MKIRELGHNGPNLCAVGLGCLGLSAFHGGRDSNESMRSLNP